MSITSFTRIVDVTSIPCGRSFNVTLRNVCLGKWVALAVILTEVDAEDNKYNRGTKSTVIPAHTQLGCRDITVRRIKFVLSEELDVSGSPNALHDTRSFCVRFIANHTGSTFVCCPDVPYAKKAPEIRGQHSTPPSP